MTQVNKCVNNTWQFLASFTYAGDGNRVWATWGSSTINYVGNHFEWSGSTSTMVKYYYANSQRVGIP